AGPVEEPAADTPVVSGEKKKKRKSGGEASAAAESIPKISKFVSTNEEVSTSPKSQDSSESESGTFSDAEEVEKPAKKTKLADGEGYVEADFDATEFGLSRHATRGDLKDLVARGGVQYDQIVEQLRLSRLANSNPAPAPAVAPVSQQTMIVSDMSNFHITVERVTADGFKRLRDKCDGERRSQRVIDRNLLISADAQKLIGQLLATFKVPAFASWKTWSDDTFFEAMAKIFPAGKTLQVKHLQDFLGKTRCVFDLANHPASILSFVAEINEGTRVYQGELDYAKEKGFIDTVQKEAVATLMNRITAKA
ncbi:hypothetical protein B484DRAFT_2784, partial [Ochromonadaceae sp. CCMP2298]